jgi:hypothetical protein
VAKPTTLAPAPTSFFSGQGHGKGKAVGHLRKFAAQSAPLEAVHRVSAKHKPFKKDKPLKAKGPPASVSHGPPTVPPGQAKHSQNVAVPGGSNGRGGGR